MVYRNSWFLESRATSLDMAEAFLPRRHLRVEAFTESALIIVSKTPELEKLGTWKLVANALQNTPLGLVRDGFVLPVLPQKFSTIVFSIQKFCSVVLVEREMQFENLQVHSGLKGLIHGASVFDSFLSPRESRL